ncbi:2745_t:CDS:2 [Paraglomus brasilianum]|uniref:2745_t:CDS:1 n=1 Tax=Paraglomus brasilianum TaxID=144538 RepID=A0A9N8WHU1_9GLOM|nr:2745_t:CDS:2 [Paraglomus brasilianum]
MSNQSSNAFRSFDDVDSNTEDNDYHGHTLIFDSSIMHNFEDGNSEEGSDEEYEDCEDDIEADNDNNELINEDILISESETCDSLTPCVVLEKRNEVVEVQEIWNLIGAWELDSQAVDVNKQVERLGHQFRLGEQSDKACANTGKHAGDITTSLELLGNMVLHVAKKDDSPLKERVLRYTVQMLQALQESEPETSDRAPIPRPFVIRTILKNHGMSPESLNYNNIINTTIT